MNIYSSTIYTSQKTIAHNTHLSEQIYTECRISLRPQTKPWYSQTRHRPFTSQTIKHNKFWDTYGTHTHAVIQNTNTPHRRQLLCTGHPLDWKQNYIALCYRNARVPSTELMLLPPRLGLGWILIYSVERSWKTCITPRYYLARVRCVCLCFWAAIFAAGGKGVATSRWCEVSGLSRPP